MLVDRLKNLGKLKGGEDIAIEAMESAFGASVYCNGQNGGIMCYGDGDMDRPVALVQINGPELEKWAKASNVHSSSLEELCKTNAAQKAVMDNLNSLGKAADLGSNELLCAVALIPGTGPTTGEATPTSPWTPENFGLTASNKLNRKPVQKACAPLLDEIKKKAIR